MMKTAHFFICFFVLLNVPSRVAFVHEEAYDGRTMEKKHWYKTQLAEIKLDNESLKFGSLDLKMFIENFSGNTEEKSDWCGRLLKHNLDLYEEIIRNISIGNVTVLSEQDLDILTSFNAWGSDVKHALYTLNHWNWVSIDMQCKLARLHWTDRRSEKTQYCAYEIETGNDVKKNLVVGYCLPVTCTSVQAELIGESLANSVRKYWTEIVPNTTDQLKKWVDCVPSYQIVSWYKRPRSLVIFGILVLLFSAVVIASLARFKVRGSDHPPIVNIFVEAFSLQSSIKKLWHVPERGVSNMNGLKTLTMLFMIFCHIYMVKQAFDIDLDESREAFRRHILGSLMYNGTYSVGTFFLAAGALQMFVTMSKYEEARNKRFSLTMWICAVINRYLRLIPLLVFTTLLIAELLSYFSYPLWTYIDASRRCPADYWRHLLLVQNLQELNLCVTWTWYVAVDFQLFLLNLPLVCLIQHKPKLGLSVMGFLFVLACALKGWLVLYYGYPPNLMPFLPIPSYNPDFTHYTLGIYMRPQGWWSTYLIGLALGYALFKFDLRRSRGDDETTVDFSPILYWPMSALAAAFMLWTVFGIHPVANGFKSTLYDALYSSSMSATWAIGWAWVIFACHFSPRAKYLNSFLSCPPMIFLSNLTYSCYLIHMPLVFGILHMYGRWMGGRPRLRYDLSEMIIIAIGTTLISYLAALLLNVLVEGPAARIQSILIKAITQKCFPRKPQRRSADVVNGDGENMIGEREKMCALTDDRTIRAKPRPKTSLRFSNIRKPKRDTIPEEREMEEFSGTSLMRPAERYPSRRL